MSLIRNLKIIRTILYDYLCYHTTKPTEQAIQKGKGRVLLCISGFLGDGIVVADAVQTIANACKQNGRKLTVVIPSALEAIYTQYLSDIETFGFDFELFMTNLAYHRKAIQQIRSVYYDRVVSLNATIVPAIYMLEQYFQGKSRTSYYGFYQGGKLLKCIFFPYKWRNGKRIDLDYIAPMIDITADFVRQAFICDYQSKLAYFKPVSGLKMPLLQWLKI